MMSKNKIIIISLIIFLIVIFTIFIKNKKSNNLEQLDKTQNKIKIESSYDEETRLYYVKDEETGEIIGASQNEEDLEFYKENPDYNPNPLQPRSTNIQDFISYPENVIEQ